MMTFFKRAYDSFFGAGEAAVTVPPLDGALLPNHALDRADLLASVDAPDNLVRFGDDILFSSGSALHAIAPDGEIRLIETFKGEILALATDRNGILAISVSGAGILFRGGPLDGRTLDKGFGRTDCVTALAFDMEGRLFVAVGSSDNAAGDWSRDLMERRASGSVWRIDTAGQATRLADRLAWPGGVAPLPDGRVIVSESWRHRLLDVAGPGKAVADNLPAYPGRIGPAEGQGFWLCMFAPRRQMIEFVLRERAFRTRMMAEIEPDLWMAPSLSSGKTFREPLQGGAVKQLGVLKPWAPSRSYGLVARLDDAFVPTTSYHSRSDGSRHGITSGLSVGDRLFVTSKGGDALLALPTNAADGGAE